MKTKVLAVVSRAGAISRNPAGEAIYQIIDGPRQGQRGTLAQLEAEVGLLEDETEAKFLFVLDETGEITGALGTVEVLTETGIREERNLEDVFQALLNEQQPDLAFLRDLLKADSLDDLFGLAEDDE